VAGLFAGLFAYFCGEPHIDRALLLEEGGAFNEVVSRPVQKLGLVVAAILYGASVGGVFGLVFAFLRDRMATEDDWGRSLRLAIALFAGVFFLPFLKYPADPPGTGDPATIGERTAVYLTTVALCLLAVFAAWYADRRLRARGTSAPVRRASVGVGFAAVIAALFLALPPASEPGSFPGDVLWDFRVAALGTQAVLWAVLGAVFGALCERARRGGAA
jgi:predicted cobalt transporter CbtA